MYKSSVLCRPALGLFFTLLCRGLPCLPLILATVPAAPLPSLLCSTIDNVLSAGDAAPPLPTTAASASASPCSSPSPTPPPPPTPLSWVPSATPCAEPPAVALDAVQLAALTPDGSEWPPSLHEALARVTRTAAWDGALTVLKYFLQGRYAEAATASTWGDESAEGAAGSATGDRSRSHVTIVTGAAGRRAGVVSSQKMQAWNIDHQGRLRVGNLPWFFWNTRALLA